MSNLPNILPASGVGSSDGGGAKSSPVTSEKSGEPFEHLMTRAMLPASNEANGGSEIFPLKAKDSKFGEQTSGKDHPKTTGGNSDNNINTTTPPETNVAPINLEIVPIQTAALVVANADSITESSVETAAADFSGEILAVSPKIKIVSTASVTVEGAVISQHQPGIEANNISVKSGIQEKKSAAVQSLTGEKTLLLESNTSMTPAISQQTSAFARNASVDSQPPMLTGKSILQSPQPGLSATPDSQEKIPSQIGSQMNGTSVAQQDEPMKKAENINKIADSSGKILPNASVSLARENILPARENISAMALSRASQMSATVTANSTQPNSTIDAAQPSADLIAGAASADLRSRLLDRVQDMVVLHATRLSDSGNDSLQVVLKPGAGTQLSLELRQLGNGVEAQAVLQRGDFGHLNQQWPALQQQLEQRGIRLAPLTNDANFAGGDGSHNFQNKQNEPAETDLSPVRTFAGVAPVGLPLQTGAGAQIHRGWQSWA